MCEACIQWLKRQVFLSRQCRGAVGALRLLAALAVSACESVHSPGLVTPAEVVRCRLAGAVRSVPSDDLRLRMGESFHYVRLEVLAVDEAGRALPSVPISVTVEGVDPAVLMLRSDWTGTPDGKVLALPPGCFEFRFSTMCEGHGALAAIQAEVVP